MRKFLNGSAYILAVLGFLTGLFLYSPLLAAMILSGDLIEQNNLSFFLYTAFYFVLSLLCLIFAIAFVFNKLNKNKFSNFGVWLSVLNFFGFFVARIAFDILINMTDLGSYKYDSLTHDIYNALGYVVSSLTIIGGILLVYGGISAYRTKKKVLVDNYTKPPYQSL